MATPEPQCDTIYLFLEFYVLDVIGELGARQTIRMKSQDLQATFGTDASEWREVVREVLGLSESVDQVIRDLWMRGREGFPHPLGGFDAVFFAQRFVEEQRRMPASADPDHPESAAPTQVIEGSQT